jgi:nitrogen fixation NifU-like protein
MDLEDILDRYEQPAYRGALVSPPARRGSATNPRCGDVVTMFVVLERDRLGRVRFEGAGCTISQAAADITAEMAEGRTLASLHALHLDDVLERLGPANVRTRLDCASVPLTALRSALANE